METEINGLINYLITGLLLEFFWVHSTPESASKKYFHLNQSRTLELYKEFVNLNTL